MAKRSVLARLDEVVDDFCLHTRYFRITTREEFAAEIRDEYAKYAKLVKEVGAKLD